MPDGSRALVDTFALAAPPWPTFDPFLFCVHHLDAYPRGDERMAPAASLDGRQIGMDFAGKDGWRMYHGDVVPGFPAHPHRGFETVTLARRGYIDHSDSLGAAARFGHGDCQWMTAGRGIVHSEMFPLIHRDQPNPTELFQIWLNLPSHDKMVSPHFTMLWGETIPTPTFTDEGGRSVRTALVAGSIGSHRAPAPPPNSWASQPNAHVAIWPLRFEAEASFRLPEAPPGLSRTLYFFVGERMAVDGHAVPSRTGVRLRSDVSVELRAGATPAEALLLQGRPIDEPVAHYGPFVMNTQAEIEQAIADYQRDRFGGWPWDRNDPVHGRDASRFARHADGREERRERPAEF